MAYRFEIPSKRTFTNWLKGKKPSQHVGTPGSCSTCPVAMFFNERGFDVHVSGDSVRSYPDIKLGFRERREVPEWLRRFITGVDNSHTGVITAERALEILKWV
jgi:hypothetical protein